MALSRRYQPSHPAGQVAVYGIDLSALLPPGVGLTQVAVAFQTNANPPQATTGISGSNTGFRGRRAWVTVSGGVAGTDYQLTWTLTDSVGNVWYRVMLLLCASTS